jgi:pimeloyl-ACP methyl ester carboxylesterase
MPTTMSKDGTTIAYDKIGTGPPLILVDGATVMRAYDVPYANALAPHFTVMTYDRRGRGDSSDTLPYAVEREIEDLNAVITEAGGQANVIGFSSGAVLALRAAAAGADIRKLALYEAPFLVDASRPPMPDDYVEHLDALVSDGRRGDAFAYFLTTAVGMPAELVEPMRGEAFWPGSESVAHTIAYDGRIMGNTMSGRPLPPEPWTSVTVPTLVMTGGNSPEMMHSGARALLHFLPNGEIRTLPGQDHGPTPEALTPELVRFFIN